MEWLYLCNIWCACRPLGSLVCVGGVGIGCARVGVMGVEWLGGDQVTTGGVASGAIGSADGVQPPGGEGTRRPPRTLHAARSASSLKRYLRRLCTHALCILACFLVHFHLCKIFAHLRSCQILASRIGTIKHAYSVCYGLHCRI